MQKRFLSILIFLPAFTFQNAKANVVVDSEVLLGGPYKAPKSVCPKTCGIANNWTGGWNCGVPRPPYKGCVCECKIDPKTLPKAPLLPLKQYTSPLLPLKQYTPPPGDYQKGCLNIRFDGKILNADCVTGNKNPPRKPSKPLDVSQCRATIKVCPGGDLACGNTCP